MAWDGVRTWWDDGLISGDKLISSWTGVRDGWTEWGVDRPWEPSSSPSDWLSSSALWTEEAASLLLWTFRLFWVWLERSWLVDIDYLVLRDGVGETDLHMKLSLFLRSLKGATEASWGCVKDGTMLVLEQQWESFDLTVLKAPPKPPDESLEFDMENERVCIPFHSYE